MRYGLDSGRAHRGRDGGIGIQRQRIDARLAELVPDADATDHLRAAMRYALLAPGKRVRPLVTILSFLDMGGHGRGALDAACAVEMIHAASLIMDDLPMMDDSDFRRGRLSTHRVFGEDVALLASVALLSAAHETVSDLDGVPPETRCAIVKMLSRVSGAGGLSGGQARDLRNHSTTWPRDVADINHGKTGVLFVAAVDVAAILCGAAPKDQARLRSFAFHFGQAFQLADDIDDVSIERDTDRSRDSASIAVLGASGTRDALSRHISGALACLTDTSPLAGLVYLLRDRREHAPESLEQRLAL